MRKKLLAMVAVLIIAFTATPLSVAASSDYVVTKNGTVTYTANEQRTATCDRMNQFASVQWSIPAGKSLTYSQSSGRTVTLSSGDYTGIPYTQFNRDYSNPTRSVVQSRIDAALAGGEVYGLDCASAVSYAVRYGMGMTNSDTYLKRASSAYLVSSFVHDGMKSSAGVTDAGYIYRNNLTKVGNYGAYTGYSNTAYTDTIVAVLNTTGNYTSGNIFTNVYEKMKPGDILVRRENGGTAHVVLVTKVILNYNDSTLDTAASKVLITDQYAATRAANTAYSSSWRMNKELTFNQLLKNNYLPVTAIGWAD